MEYFIEALSIKESIGDQEGIANTYTSIGETYEVLQDYDSSLMYYQRALQIAIANFSKLEEKTGIIISRLRLSVAQNKQGIPDADQYAKNALEMACKIDNPKLIIHTDNQRKTNILLIILVLVFAGVIVLLFFLFRLKSAAFKRQQMLREKENIIHIQEKKIDDKEKQLLQEQLESKNRELASKALEMLRYNDTISNIVEKLESLNKSLDNHQEVEKSVKDIITELEHHSKRNIWNEFDKIL